MTGATITLSSSSLTPSSFLSPPRASKSSDRRDLLLMPATRPSGPTIMMAARPSFGAEDRLLQGRLYDSVCMSASSTSVPSICFGPCGSLLLIFRLELNVCLRCLDFRSRRSRFAGPDSDTSCTERPAIAVSNQARMPSPRSSQFKQGPSWRYLGTATGLLSDRAHQFCFPSTTTLSATLDIGHLGQLALTTLPTIARSDDARSRACDIDRAATS